MKTLIKISLISGLLASGIALANPSSDIPSAGSSQECHHGKHAKGHHGHHHRGGKGSLLTRMADKLELTPEQRTSVSAVEEKSKPQMADIKEKMRANRKALRELGQDGKHGADQVQALAREQGNLVANLIIERSAMRNDIRAILTDTQREQLKQMRQKHGHGHGHEHHHKG